MPPRRWMSFNQHPLRGSKARALFRHLVVDVLLVTAVAIIAVMIFDRRTSESRLVHAVEVTRGAVRLIQATLDLHVALGRESLDHVEYPSTIDPQWFSESVPNNELVGNGHPWMEVAVERDRGLLHPRDITVDGSRGGAMFWYNPARGVVRARVPRTLSDADAVALYNDVNRTKVVELSSIAATEDRE
ncbi:MAG: hypothetical protein SGJ11_04930 [Phycisphaerae bacterium]|nr:hypothetical protein [Phycisphaerae bacterium]